MATGAIRANLLAQVAIIIYLLPGYTTANDLPRVRALISRLREARAQQGAGGEACTVASFGASKHAHTLRVHSALASSYL